jgi:hypothetical protein
MSARTAALLYDAPGDILSPSSASQYLGCSAKYFYRKVAKIEDPPTGALTLGSAVHSAITENFAQKMETFEDLDIAGVSAIYNSVWTEKAKVTEFRDDEDPSTLKAQGLALTLKYLDEACPAIQPAAVELHVSGRIGGVLVQGYIDLLDVEGRIIDLKTAAKKPSEISSDYAFQLATYTQLCDGASGEARLDTLVKTKAPQLIQISCSADTAHVDATTKMYPLVQQSIRAGVWLPNRSHYMCSRKYCGAWRNCQRDFGGTVAE